MTHRARVSRKHPARSRNLVAILQAATGRQAKRPPGPTVRALPAASRPSLHHTQLTLHPNAFAPKPIEISPRRMLVTAPVPELVREDERFDNASVARAAGRDDREPSRSDLRVRRRSPQPPRAWQHES